MYLKNFKNAQKELQSSCENVRFRISETLLSASASLSVRGHSALPHVNVTAHNSVQLNMLLLKESKCQSFPSAGQTMNNCYFKENRQLELTWQQLNRILFKAKIFMHFFFYIATVLHCTALDVFGFYYAAEDMPCVKINLCCSTSGSASLLFSAN